MHARPTGLAAVRLRHRALPQRDLADVRLDTELLGVRLHAPLVISARTGGTARRARSTSAWPALRRTTGWP